MTAQKQKASKAVHAYVRGTEAALWIQIVVAVAAVLASVALVLIVQQKGAEIRTQNGVLRARGQALESLVGLPRLIQNDQFDEAALSLNAALVALNAEPGATDDAETSQYQRSLRRALAQVQYLKGDARAAIGTMNEVRALPGADAGEASSEALLLATYYCAAGAAESARPLLTAEARRDPGVLSSVREAGCEALVRELTQTQAATEVAAPSEAYKIRLVFLHIRNEPQRASAIDLAQRLCAAGYAVPGIEHVAEPRSYPARGDIRYYYAEQRGEAERIAALAGPAANPMVARRLVGLDGLPRDRVEIWLADARVAERAQANRRFSCAPAEEARAFSMGLARALNSSDRMERLRAAQLVVDRMRDPSDRDMAPALLDQLVVEDLSATGRLNVLYLLNVRPVWSGADSGKLQERLDLVESRAASGAPIGNQTRDCINSLRLKAAGRRSRNVCGGL